MYDCIIIGAGPAGLTSAIYAARAGHSVVVFEEMIHGGQVASTPEVENYPAIKKISGVEFAMNIYEQATDLGVEVIYDSIISANLLGKVKTVKTSSKEYEAKTVIIANGAKRRKLGCDGEERLSGMGVSYCATCDGAFYKGKVTAIVGGGNTALEDALFLSNNCKEVHLIHHRDEFRGSQILIDSVVTKENIIIHYDSAVTKIDGERKVENISVQNVKTNDVEIINVSGIFIAVGLEPTNSIFEGQIELDKGGYITASENCHTNVEGVYVAGDTRTKGLRQIITAASDGAIAAVEMSTYVLAEGK
ncbi:MAG: thioredoxin-disulfide reductase [Oscillospiraceae bacterium]